MATTFKLVSRPLKPGEFKASPQPRDYEAIGEFVTACSLLEVAMHIAIRQLLRIDETVARTLIGERRTGQLVDLLRFAFERKIVPLSPTGQATLDGLLLRAQYVNSVRAVVAHKPCNTDGISLAFHNSITAERKSKEFEYVCTAAQLKACADHALFVAGALRDAVEFGEPHREGLLPQAQALLASVERLDLPSPPRSSNPQTAKPKRPPRTPAKKS